MNGETTKAKGGEAYAQSGHSDDMTMWALATWANSRAFTLANGQSSYQEGDCNRLLAIAAALAAQGAEIERLREAHGKILARLWEHDHEVSGGHSWCARCEAEGGDHYYPNVWRRDAKWSDVPHDPDCIYSIAAAAIRGGKP